MVTAEHTIDVDPATLKVDSDIGPLSDGAVEDLGAPSEVTRDGDALRWSLPKVGLAVSARPDGDRIALSVTADKTASLSWPVMPATVRSIQLPNGDGLDIPADDPLWTDPETGIVNEDGRRLQDLTFPGLGFSGATPGTGGSYIIPTDIGSTVTFTDRDKRLGATVKHDFDPAAATGTYTVILDPTRGGPIDSSLDYRQWLDSHGQLSSLNDKIRENPDVEKLLGAFHVYLWGDGRSAQGVEALRAAGLRKLWLGYDSGDPQIGTDAVDAAEQTGYLIGPYDTFSNVQDPKGEIDAPTSKWPDPIWPDGCVLDAKGKPESGFGGRGCYLSSEALAQHPELLAQREQQMSANGVNSYFVDVDGTGETFRDYSPQHPMTEQRDRDNRLARMRALMPRFVVGSETVGAWANSAVDFSHGSSTPTPDGIWKLQRDREFWGGWSGKNGPANFLKPVDLPADITRQMFDFTYRIPMYQTVFHDSVVSTDRWELGLNKFPALAKTRTLAAMLYNAPLNYNVNLDTIAEWGPSMATAEEFFQFTQDAAGTAALTDFRWLTADKQVQRTEFGDQLTVVANFGSVPYTDPEIGTLEAGCVTARNSGEQATTLCP
ncbi:glycoside hydrolase [Nocardia sp. XZ_19_385]|uniref:glycoside hydrolase n=1 Tax=Nocardia sp. XZ_19_385 TaxID=2769488 RepID=UPI0018909280|nr:glycoside hydrolase [Nocardia sp. XZ_19_385]